MARIDARRSTYLIAALLAASFSYDLMRMPIQVSDSLSLLLDVQQSPSLLFTFIKEATRGTYLRPAFHVQIKMLFDLADGHYWLVFRGFHAVLLCAAIFLFTRALRVRTWTDFGAAVFALTVFTGLNTFRGTVREAYAINHFLEIVVCCLAAFNLARSRGGWWSDLAAIVLFVFASLTLESGLLVWVVLAAAWACGARGVSGRAIGAATVLLAGYFWIRFAYLDVALEARPSGFLVSMLEWREINDRFGANPIWFHAYNVATSMLSVLFSDPDGGVFEIARAWLQGDVPPRLYVAVASSALTTGVIAWAAIRARRRRDVSLDSVQVFVVFCAVLAANAAMSYSYTKHEIISAAGAFYALAAFEAVRYAVAYVVESSGKMSRAAAVLMLVLAAGAGLWAFRSAGVHHMLRTQAFKERNDWARIAPDMLRDVGTPAQRQAAALVRQLRGDALAMRIPNSHVLPRWQDRWWGE
jgi:hypothetical protein